MHLARNDFDGAIKACKQGITKFPDNPSPVMELSNLHAANGDYRAAINTYMKLLDDREESSLWNNLLSKSKGGMISPGSNWKEDTKELQNW